MIPHSAQPSVFSEPSRVFFGFFGALHRFRSERKEWTWKLPRDETMAVGQNLVPLGLVNVKIGGTWIFIHPKMARHRLCNPWPCKGHFPCPMGAAEEWRSCRELVPLQGSVGMFEGESKIRAVQPMAMLAGVKGGFHCLQDFLDGEQMDFSSFP